MIEITWKSDVWDTRTTVEVDFKNYPAGEPLFDMSQDYGKGFINMTEITVKTTYVSELMNALFLVDAARFRGARQEITLVLPYVPGGRQDRINKEGDGLFTLKSVAREINARDFREVLVLDPHSEVTTALIDRCRPMPILDSDSIDKLKKVGYDGIIVPDAGAGKRAELVAGILGVPTFQAWKKRDVATGKLSGFGIEQLPVSANQFLIVDDICDGGGTFIGLVNLPELKIRICDLYVSHGLFTQGTDKLTEVFRTVYTTDSVYKPSGPIVPADLIVFKV